MHGNRAVGAQKFHSSQFYWMSTMLYALQNSVSFSHISLLSRFYSLSFPNLIVFSNIEAHRWLALN
ncbi:hypothetical protein T11_4859 [Trichinella zimbabwensis]|uniref:Uncharacterized protein n=1 Tax=Trichinella zimbabwensis TaxID=268475 RepID=A0A0V1GMM8_9BILA|nr:hypothetical protein T11_4859 [Trichinella zimbabwensis]